MRTRIARPDFPCVGAKSALARDAIQFFEAGDLRSTDHDTALRARVQAFALAAPDDAMFVSLVALFPDTPRLDEVAFEAGLWARLRALHVLDATQFAWDPTVSDDIVFEAEMDLVIGLTACSAGQSNNFRYQPIHYEVLDVA